MSGQIPNLSDRHVWAMADRNHQPEERWMVNPSRLIGVECATCGQRWPCETRRALEVSRPDAP